MTESNPPSEAAKAFITEVIRPCTCGAEKTTVILCATCLQRIFDQHCARRTERLRKALESVKEWLAEQGCDCGTDELGAYNTCALCVAEAALAGKENGRG